MFISKHRVLVLWKGGKDMDTNKKAFLKRTLMPFSNFLCICLALLLVMLSFQNVAIAEEKSFDDLEQNQDAIVKEENIDVDIKPEQSESATTTPPSAQDEYIGLKNQPIEASVPDSEEQNQEKGETGAHIGKTNPLSISFREYTVQVSTFSELETAIDNIALNPDKKGTITVMGSFDFDETIAVNDDIEATLIGTSGKPTMGINDQSGQAGKFRHFIVSDGGKLNASQLILDGDSVGGGVNITADGTANFSDMTIQNCVEPADSNGGAIRAYSGTSTMPATVNITNCSLVNNSAKQGGALYAGQYAKVDIESTDITNNQSTDSGGGITLLGANVTNPIKATFTDVNFIENKATNTYSNGGGASISDYADVVLEGCIFERNTTNLNGGGIFADRYTNLMIKGCEFTSNDCTNKYGSGGGLCSMIYNDASSGLDISNSAFIGNKANIGGGISLDTFETNTIRNCTITGNIALSNGGGIYLGSSVSDAHPKPTLLLSGTTVNENTAVSGAGIFAGKYLTYGSIVSVFEGSKIIDNTASQNGGGIYTEDSSYETVDISADTILSGNKAEGLYILPADSDLITTHATHILASSFSSPYVDYAYNNYDINYTAGSLVVVTSVIYDANGGVGNFTVQVGTSQTHHALSSEAVGIIKQGSQFTGWCTELDPTVLGAISYAVGDAVILNQDATPVRLYAQWKDDLPSPSPSQNPSSEPSPSASGSGKDTPNTGDNMATLQIGSIAMVMVVTITVLILYKRKICKNGQ